MLHDNIFAPEKMALMDFKMTKNQVEAPENFDFDKIAGHYLDKSLHLSFRLEDKLAKADLTITVRTDSKEQNIGEASGVFHLIFIYRIENLEQLLVTQEGKKLVLDAGLANALSSVSYSTSRGILMAKLQGTALQNFVLPIIDPNSLLVGQAD